MAKTETLYAPASWGELNALKALDAKVGLDKVQSFERKGARFAAVVLADEDGDEDEATDSGSDDKPAFLKDDDAKDDSNGDSKDSDDSNGSSDNGEGEGGDDDREEPPFAEDGDDDGKEPSISEVFDLVKQIAEAVGVPVGGPEGPEGLDALPTDDLGAGDLAAGPAGPPELPDVGSPPAGGPALPPPLPPPAPKGKPGAMPSFARVAGYDEAKTKKRVLVAELQEAGSVSNKQIMDEAGFFMADHRVAKIDRTSRAEDDVALVTLVAR